MLLKIKGLKIQRELYLLCKHMYIISKGIDS